MTTRAFCLEPCLALVVAWLTASTPAQSATEALAVIVHPDNPVRDLSLTQLRAYFMLDYRKWDDGNAAELYLRPRGSKEMQILRHRVYRMSPLALRKYWEEKVFVGKITVKPTVAVTAAAAIKQTSKDRGAFTVVLAKDVPETGVRVVKVDGKLPADADYPLVGPEQSPAARPVPEPPE